MKKLLVVLLILGLASPVMAGQWQFKGSFRTHLGYYDTDSDWTTGGPAMDPTIGGADDDGTLLSLSGQSRFQAVGIASDKLIGVFEMGLREAGGPTAEELYLRLAYATWNFGAGKLIVGKNYTPATFLGYSGMMGDLGDQGDANMLVAGLSYIGRQPQIRLAFGDFDIALIQPNNVAALGSVDTNQYIPRVEASYVFRTDLVNIRPVAGFQTYEAEDAAGQTEDITSYLLGVGASFNFGPAYLKLTASYLQNAGNYGQFTELNTFSGLTSASGTIGGNVEDSDLYQGTFVVGMKFNEMVGVEAGLGYGKVELGDAEQQGYVYYVQAPITLAQGVTLIPEIGQLDRDSIDLGIAGVPDVELGKMFYVDLVFRVDF